MALLEMSFQSDVLGFEQELAVILPDPRALKLDENGAPDTDDLTVLYLLHGYHGNHRDWTRYTMLERYVEQSRKKIAVVMPSGLTNYYADMARGWKYFTYIAEEVPLLAQSYFHISAKPENTHVAGLSMGGAGSMKLALTYPERFATVSSFSGALDPVGRANKIDTIAPERVPHYNNIYGDDKDARIGGPEDIMHLLDVAAASGKPLPKIYQACGTADFLWEDNLAFRDKAIALGYDLTFYEEEGVGHEWEFWNSEVKKLIERLPAKAI